MSGIEAMFVWKGNKKLKIYDTTRSRTVDGR